MRSVYRIGEFAEKIGRSVSTVRRWEAEDRISVRRSRSGQRFFTDADGAAVLSPGVDRHDRHYRRDRRSIGSCRVSSANQRADRTAQVTARQQFCLARGLRVDRWVSEVGGAMNLTRRKLLELMVDVKAGRVSTLVIARQDRLARFGFDDLHHEAETAGCEVLVADQESLSPQHERVQDRLAIVPTFWCRLDGLRRDEKRFTSADLGGESS